MVKNEDDYYSVREILDNLKAFVLNLAKHWWLILLAAFAGSGLGTIYYYHIQKPKFEAVCTFILEEKQGGVSGLSGIASQFGIDVGGLSGAGLFAGDNILDVIKSKNVVQKVLLTNVDSSVPTGPTLGDMYLEFSGIRSSFEKNNRLVSFHLSNKKDATNPVQDSILNVIYETIIKSSLTAERTSKKGTIIKVKVVSINSVFAKLMAERLVEEASKLYLNIKTGTAQSNINQMQRRSDSLLALLNRKSYTAAVSQPLDFNPGIKTLNVPVEIANRDKTVIATLYTEVTKNLEVSKLLLSQQTPVIQLLDGPGSYLKDSKKGIVYLIIVFAFVSSIICITLISIKYFLAKMLK